MALPIFDTPIPPELAVDEPPLSDAVLARLDEAFSTAADDQITSEQWDALYAGADPLETPDAPAAAHLLPGEIRGGWLTDDGAAEWCMRHVARIDVDLRNLTEQREEWATRIDRWFAQSSGVMLRRRAFFVANLIGYGAARRAADPKAPKTLNLPSGRITSSDRAAVVKVLDDEALAGWLAAHELLTAPDGAELVNVTTKVYAVPLRKVLAPAGTGVVVVVPTGEPLSGDDLPPGLAVEAAHTDYDVRPA